ncbi:MAG: flavin reductase family protein, partial [Accumulibacter sp.]|uniref:flavin reductase family protein n=1 Tax=Accumulibacter sp. TaxID=2053492 RepID=UPI002FC29BD7
MRPIRPPLGSSPDALETAVIDLPGSDTRHARATRDLVCRDFRDALGSFATGVTVLTTLATDGKPVGLTISSFNTVSLDPPLILWSLACDSPRLAAFRHAGHYAVNVLAADQEVISNRFASRDEDRFDALAFTPGLAGVPLIQGCSAWFECSHEAHYPGGDHLIFLGRVQRFARGQTADPLIFHAGRYRR